MAPHMANYTLIQAAQGLRNLLEERAADLRKTKAGRFHEPALVELRAEIDALPAAITGSKPLVEDLDTADALHDGYGAAIFYATEVALRLPDTSAEVRAAALRIRDAFVAALAELQDAYVMEAHRAAERRSLLQTMRADLELFPVRKGETLLQVAERFLDAGDKLNALLSQRGDVPKADRRKAAVLRSRAVGLLNRLRADLREEVERTPSLPRDLEQRVFGYLDTLSAMKKKPGSGKPEPAAPPAGPTEDGES